jgi:hypothetical protein
MFGSGRAPAVNDLKTDTNHDLATILAVTFTGANTIGVVRKRDPDDVVYAFMATVRRLRTQVQDIDDVVPSLANRRRVLEDALIRLAVTWEVFRSDWFIACMNRDSSEMKRAVTKAVEQQLNKGVGPSVGALKSGWVQVVVPPHPTLEDIAAGLDPNNYNLSLPKSIRNDGGLLAPQHQARVQRLSSADDQLLDALIALRNTLAHRSISSVDRMNTAIANIDRRVDPGLATPSGSRRIRLDGVGRYLGAITNNGNAVEQARCLHLHDRVSAIAGKLG